MTREEAIEYLKDVGYQQSAFSRFEPFYEEGSDYKKAVDILCDALRAQPAKLDRSRWEGCEHCDVEWEPRKHWRDDNYGSHEFRIDGDSILYHDSQLGWEGVKIKFCPFCGCPLTEEAWAELAQKIGGNDSAHQT